MRNDLLGVFLQTICDGADNIREIAMNAQTSSNDRFIPLSVRQHKTIKAVIELSEINSDGTSLKELAEKLQLSSATTSELVETLVQKDILVRNPCPVDRRAVRILPSEYTLNAVNIGKCAVRNLCEPILKEFSEAELNLICNCLEKLKNNTEIIKRKRG